MLHKQFTAVFFVLNPKLKVCSFNRLHSLSVNPSEAICDASLGYEKYLCCSVHCSLVPPCFLYCFSLSTLGTDCHAVVESCQSGQIPLHPSLPITAIGLTLISADSCLLFSALSTRMCLSNLSDVRQCFYLWSERLSVYLVSKRHCSAVLLAALVHSFAWFISYDLFLILF